MSRQHEETISELIDNNEIERTITVSGSRITVKYRITAYENDELFSNLETARTALRLWRKNAAPGKPDTER